MNALRIQELADMSAIDVFFIVDYEEWYCWLIRQLISIYKNCTVGQNDGSSCYGGEGILIFMVVGYSVWRFL